MATSNGQEISTTLTDVTAKSSSGVATELVVRVYPAASLRIVMCLLVVDLTFVALYLLPNLLGHSPRMFDLDAEFELPTWYASAKLFLLAQALMALALLVARRSRLDATPFLFLAAVALLCLRMRSRPSTSASPVTSRPGSQVPPAQSSSSPRPAIGCWPLDRCSRRRWGLASG